MEIYVNVSEINSRESEMAGEAAENRTELLSGCETVTDSDLDALADQLEEAMAEHGIHYLFAEGMFAALCFVACPESENMHGKRLGEFAANSWAQASDEFILESILGLMRGGAR